MSDVKMAESTQSFDSEALRLEYKIFLKSPLGQYLKRRLWLYYKGGGSFDLTLNSGDDFDKIVIRREVLTQAWSIRGRIGEKVYGLIVADVEFQHLKLV